MTFIARKKVSRWDEAIDLDITDRWVKGESAGQIAAHLSSVIGAGFTRNAVIGRLSRLGAPKRVNPRANEHAPRKVVRPVKLVPPKPITDTERRDYDAAPFLQDGKPYTIGTIPASGRCRWIYGEPDIDSALCGHPTHKQSNYCEHHYARAYQPQIPRR